MNIPKPIRYLFSIFIFVGAVTAITFVNSYFQSADESTTSPQQNCQKMEEKISRDISAANYCKSDDECRASRVSCPWGGKRKCGYILVNKNHSIALLNKETVYFSSCLGEEAFAQKFSFCKELSAGQDCPLVINIPLKCENNKCVEAITEEKQ